MYSSRESEQSLTWLTYSGWVQDLQLHKYKATKEHVEKRSGERNVDSRFQLQQLEEDGGSSTRQQVV